jgi:hypothetical protein
VGVNVEFQQPNPGVSRSPFFAPVPINDAAQIAKMVRFVTRLMPDVHGGPSNTAGAIDFARNNVIGLTRAGQPNVIGDGIEDPPATQAWPKLTSDRQIFVALSFGTSYGDGANPPAGFKPRTLKDIVDSLHATRTVVHSIDTTFINPEKTTPAAGDPEVDNDYFAIQTAGIGENTIAAAGLNWSPIDMEAVILTENGLNDLSLVGRGDVGLPAIIASSCRAGFTPAAAPTAVTLKVQHAGGEAGVETFTKDLTTTSF